MFSTEIHLVSYDHMQMILKLLKIFPNLRILETDESLVILSFKNFAEKRPKGEVFLIYFSSSCSVPKIDGEIGRIEATNDSYEMAESSLTTKN